MIKRSLAGISLFAAAVLGAMSARAQEVEYARSGVYIGLGGGAGFEEFNGDGYPINFDDGLVVDGWLGYRLIPNLALEAQVEYGAFEGELFSFFDIDVDLITATANARVYVLTDRIQPFVLAGVGMMSADLNSSAQNFSRSESDEGFAARFGGGVDFWVAESIALCVASSYVLATGNAHDYEYVSLAAGVQFRY